MLKEGLSVIGSEVTSGDTGGGQDGCLACNKRQVVSLFGVMPPDNSIQQALPVIPERPRETAELITFLQDVVSIEAFWLLFRLFAIFQRVVRSLFNHMLQRDSIDLCGL